MSTLVSMMLSLGAIAALILAIAGSRLVWTGRDRKRGGLMIAVAIVILLNLLIWSVPVPQG